jgi:VIT1/CCC1 family predicted Fe2+/Mn2+ transporter
MSWGNWGGFTHVRSRASHRRRLVLTIGSLVAGVALVLVTLDFGRGGQIPLMVATIVALLILGIVLGLRPWDRG